MTTLDRYIAKQFMINVIALTVILFSFVVVIDASLNIDEFLQRAGDLAQQRGEEAPGAVRKWLVTLLPMGGSPATAERVCQPGAGRDDLAAVANIGSVGARRHGRSEFSGKRVGLGYARLGGAAGTGTPDNCGA